MKTDSFNTSCLWSQKTSMVGAILVFLTLCFSVGEVTAQSKVLEELRKSDKARRGVFLYPSTIRMVNLPQLESYYLAIKDVRRANFFPLRKDRFTHHDFLQTRVKLEEEDHFEEYMSFDSGENGQVIVLGRKKGAETIFLSEREGKYYMGYIQGRINLLQVAALQRDLSDPKIIDENPLLEELFKLGFGTDRSRRHDHSDDDSEDESDPDEEKKEKSKT